MITNCIIIDDEASTITRLSEYIDKIPGVELIGSSTNPLNMLKSLVGSNKPDILFMDIDMPELSGLEMVKILDKDISVVFITGYRDYALEAYEQHALDYLLKPISFEKFFNCIKRVQELGNQHQALDYIFVTAGIKGKQVKIKFDEVLYIESTGNYVVVHTLTDAVITYLTLKEVLDAFPERHFFQIHRSLVVNSDYITIVEKDEVTLNNGKQLTLGRSYKDAFMYHIKSALLKSKRRD